MSIWTRRTSAKLAGLAAAAVLVPLVPSAPAQAAPNDGVLGTVVGGVVTTTDKLLSGFGSWIFSPTVTTMSSVRASIGATSPVVAKYDGTGVGVALIDTGVVPVNGLTSGNVVQGPDLSFDAQSASLAHLDTFGHGTHMAGIIAGRDAGTSSTRYLGVAPGAKLTSLKMAPADASVDVSQMIAGIDWVVAHRNDDKTNPIRVINLSYGTNGVQSYQVDPLAHAVENAWRAGIVVVVSGGNSGGALDNPATDPYVISVGAADLGLTTLALDDTVPAFSARGTSARRVDLVAPGVSIASLRDPGSALDVAYPAAVTGDRYFRGSGTSQAAAVVSGAVAVLLQARPTLTPDQVKSVLTRSATPLVLADAAGRGAGELNLTTAMAMPALATKQSFPVSTGTGSLEKARGSIHVYDGTVPLTGENDIFGPFSTATWAKASSTATSWSGGKFMGKVWTGSCATCATVWSGTSWGGGSWSGRSWRSNNWSGRSWRGTSWG